MPGNKEDRTELLKAIRDEVWNFKDSPLYAERIKNKVYPVIGEGSHTADIMFVGEAPGKNEAKTGRPFCGTAGKVLDELLSGIGIDRTSVYITNIVKDRPPLNRDPYPKEIDAYAPFLDRQIAIIRPKIIAALGRFSAEYIMRRAGLESEIDSISKIRGRCFKGNYDGLDVLVCPLFHPCVAVYNPHRKEELAADMKILKDISSK
jgi:uracil-DNA glycosylase family 4